MAGAIAGTASLYLEPTEGLDMITLTVNNDCNGHCGHCYLQYTGSKGYASQDVLDKVLKGSYRHLAIVGKEPLYNIDHAKETSRLIREAHKHGKTVSMITNGLNLDLLDRPDLLEFLDISFDGGPHTYSDFRRADYSETIRKVRQTQVKQVNALHTIHKSNIPYIDDMVRVGLDAQFGIIMFSPYLETQNQGTNSVDRVDISHLLTSLADSQQFMDSEQTALNLDIFHARQSKLSTQEINDLIQRVGLQTKVKFFETDLLREGVMRITYDGWALSPGCSLHPANYASGTKLESTIAEAHAKLLS